MDYQCSDSGSGPLRSLAMGVFDGVHLGHQTLLAHAEAVLSFHPHPAAFFGQASDLAYITTISERSVYIPRLFTLQFNEAVSSLSPEEFLEKIVLGIGGAELEQVVVGYDFRFGKGRAGDEAVLRQWTEAKGITLKVCPPYSLSDGTLVKSRAVRDALRSDFNYALALMGHSYLMEGTVVKGEGRGSKIGFPTANLAFPEGKLIPKNGVYAGSCRLSDGREFSAAVYVGSKPTFEGQTVGVEAYLLDFEGDLYGQDLSLYLKKWLRDEMHFDSVDALLEGIRRDLEGL